MNRLVGAMSFGCKYKGCDRHPRNGNAIYRVSPKGQAFDGLCESHLRMAAAGMLYLDGGRIDTDPPDAIAAALATMRDVKKLGLG